MASYHEKMLAFVGPAGIIAINRLTTEFKDLFTTVDEETAVSAMVSYLRLHADDYELPQTAEDIFEVQKQILGSLLRAKKIVPASYGFSNEGQRQFDSLVALASVMPDIGDRVA